MRKNLNLVSIDEQCKGCDHCVSSSFLGMNLIFTSDKCLKLLDKKAPQGFWRRGGCPYATHIVLEAKVADKVRVGQQKQKKKV